MGPVTRKVPVTVLDHVKSPVTWGVNRTGMGTFFRSTWSSGIIATGKLIVMLSPLERSPEGGESKISVEMRSRSALVERCAVRLTELTSQHSRSDR